MHKGAVISSVAISTVLLLGLLSGNSAFAAAAGTANATGSMGPAPKAQCGRSDRTEKGLQGQTTSQERASGDSKRGYNCNLELVGQFKGEGAYSQDGPRAYDVNDAAVLARAPKGRIRDRAAWEFWAGGGKWTRDIVRRKPVLKYAGHVQRVDAVYKAGLKRYLLAGYPEILVVSNVVKEDGEFLGLPDAGQTWHTDTSYRERPSRGSILYALEIPRDAHGTAIGDTLFAGTGPAYDALPEAVKQTLHGRKAV